MRKVIMILGWTWAVSLAFCYGSSLAVYYTLTHPSTGDCPSGNILTLASCVLFAVFLAIAIVADVACRRKQWAVSCRLRYWALALLTIPLLFLLIDVRPLEHEYTEADVRSHDPAVLASYEPLMKTFGRRKDNPALVTSLSKVRFKNRETDTAFNVNPQAYAEVINQSWEEIAVVRKALAELDKFPGITDLGASTRLDFAVPTINFVTIRSASRVYQAYANLKAAEGDTLAAARQLSLLQRIARKSLPHCGTLTAHMIWIAVVTRNIETAAKLLKSPKCDAAMLAVLKENFPPFSVADLSWRKVFMGQNVCMQNTLRQCQAIGAAGFITGLCCEDWKSDATQFSWVRRAVAMPPYWFLYRPNLTSRELRRLCDVAIRDNDFSTFGDHRCAQAGADLRQVKTCRNFLGQKIVAYAVPSFGTAFQKVVAAKIRSDLLYLEICKRLGEPPPALADPYTKAAYAADAQGHFFSPGRDGKPGTADDITLEEKPR